MNQKPENQRRTTAMNIHVTLDEKAYMQEAADIDQRTLSNFVRMAVLKEARRIMKEFDE